MRLSRLRGAVRRRVRQVGKTAKWSDDHIDDIIATKAMDLYRRRSDADKSYGQVRIPITLSSTRVRQVHQYAWEYYVPSWVHTIQNVRELKGSTDPEGLRWRYTQGEDLAGWDWDGEHSLRLRADAQKEIVLEVSKLPVRPHIGTCAVAAADANEIAIDQDGDVANIEPEELAYLGCRIEITGGATAARDPRDIITTCIGQTRAWEAGLGTPDTVRRLQVFPPFSAPPIAGDTYEIHVDCSEDWSEYLELLVVEKLWIEDNNTNGVNAIRTLIEKAEIDFIDGIQPRQDAENPAMKGPGSLGGFPDDFDRDPRWTSGGIWAY